MGYPEGRNDAFSKAVLVGIDWIQPILSSDIVKRK